MSPDALLKAIEESVELGPTDKNYKVYVGGNRKFYFQHMDSEQMRTFIDFLNAKRINIGNPGYFYVLPFFARREAA